MSTSIAQTALVDKEPQFVHGKTTRDSRTARNKARYTFTVLAFLLPSAIPLLTRANALIRMRQERFTEQVSISPYNPAKGVNKNAVGW